MIGLGIAFIIIGAILYFNGNSINNDMDAQLESLFDKGITNPGSEYEAIGMLLIVLGIVFLIIGIVNATKDNSTKTITTNTTSPTTPTKIEKPETICSKCGTVVPEDSVYCLECGAKILTCDNPTMFCPQCGKKIPSKSKFCLNCGCDIQDFSNT